MSDKYVIRNCPASNKDFRLNCQGKAYVQKYNCVYGLLECKDCTDCVIKQIVELCKESLNSLETYVDVRSLECTTLQSILKLLDIQEVE